MQASKPTVPDTLQCPLTYEPLVRTLVLGDGETYLETAARAALAHRPDSSPLHGASLVERPWQCRNYAVEHLVRRLLDGAAPHVPQCPIRRAAFREPFLLVDDGQTYERDAIEAYLRNDAHSVTPIGTPLAYRVLLPNRTLARHLALVQSMRDCIEVPMRSESALVLALAVYDVEARNAFQARDWRALHARRAALQLPTRTLPFSAPDASSLDLSDLVLCNAQCKSAYFAGARLDRVEFRECDLSRVCFRDASMCDARLIDCRWMGEDLCLFNANLHNACITLGGALLEVGATWREVSTIHELYDELRRRGARNSATVRVVQRATRLDWPAVLHDRPIQMLREWEARSTQ